MVFNYLLLVNRLMQPGVFKSLCTYSPNLQSMHKVKERILTEYLPATAYNSDFVCDSFNLLTLKLQTPILAAFFTSNKGYIKLTG
jgi:hypothetical protein